MGGLELIGISASGSCAAEGERLTFARFLRYGLPITLVQLTVGALYVLALFKWFVVRY